MSETKKDIILKSIHSYSSAQNLKRNNKTTSEENDNTSSIHKYL